MFYELSSIAYGSQALNDLFCLAMYSIQIIKPFIKKYPLTNISVFHPKMGNIDGLTFGLMKTFKKLNKKSSV